MHLDNYNSVKEGNLTPTTLVRAGFPPNVQTPANGSAIIAAV